MSIKLPLRANAKAGFDTGDKVATDADGAASVRLQDVLSLANSTPELEREIERLRGLVRGLRSELATHESDSCLAWGETFDRLAWEGETERLAKGE